MNPSNKLKTPAGYKGRTSAAGYNLNFELATRGLIKGWEIAGTTGPAVKITNGTEGRSVAVASDGSQHSALYMDDADGIEVKLTKLPTDSWHTIVAIVRALPEGAPERPDNPESVAIFEIPANTEPLTDDEIAEHVRTSTSLGNFQGGKWCRIADAFVKANATAPAEVRAGEKAQNALGFTITGTAEGNPIEIYDSANAKLISYEIDGDTTQERYAGYNLLDVPRSYVQPESEPYRVFTLDKKIPPKTAVTIQAESIVNDSEADNTLWGLQEDGGEIWYGWGFGKAKLVETIASPHSPNKIYIYNHASGFAATTTSFEELMVTIGDAKKPYEKYVGGKATPTPDNTSPMESADIKTIELSKKNLFDKDAPFTPLDFYADDANNTYKPSGTVQGFAMPCYPSTTYTVSKAPKSGYYRLSSSITEPKNGSKWTNRVRGEDGKTATITTGPDDHYLYIRCWDNTVPYAPKDETIRTLQVELGATATPYEPYEGQIITLSQPVRLSRLDDAQDKLTRKDGIWGVWRKTYEKHLKDMSWASGGAGKPAQGFYTTSTLEIVKPNGAVLCDYLKYGANTWKEYGTIGINVAGYGWICISPEITTAEQRKAWMAEKNPVAIWERLTPTFEPLPEADQKALNKLQSFNHVTYIGTQGHQRVEYILDLAQPLLDSLEEFKIADGSITADKLAMGAVTSAKIADRAVTSDKLADEAVTSTKIGPNAVYESNLSDSLRRKLYAYPEFTYRTFEAQTGKTPSPAYTHIKILEFSFDAKVGAIYDATALCNFVKADTISQEFSFFMRWTAGAEVLGESQCLVDPANYVKFTQKTAHTLIKATAATVTAYVGINSSTVGGNYEIRKGYVTIERKA